jgi:hypothetical protein
MDKTTSSESRTKILSVDGATIDLSLKLLSSVPVNVLRLHGLEGNDCALHPVNISCNHTQSTPTTRAQRSRYRPTNYQRFRSNSPISHHCAC